MSAALRHSLERAACCDWVESELEFAVVVVADVVVPPLDPLSSSFVPATPAALPITAAVTATAATLRTNIGQSSLGGRSPGHLLEVESARRGCGSIGALIVGDCPGALKAAPFSAVSEVQEGVSAAAPACREPEARPATGRLRVSEFAHRFTSSSCASLK